MSHVCRQRVNSAESKTTTPGGFSKTKAENCQAFNLKDTGTVYASGMALRGWRVTRNSTTVLKCITNY